MPGETGAGEEHGGVFQAIPGPRGDPLVTLPQLPRERARELRVVQVAVVEPPLQPGPGAGNVGTARGPDAARGSPTGMPDGW